MLYKKEGEKFTRALSEDIVREARKVYARSFRPTQKICSPDIAAATLRNRLRKKRNETFSALFLTSNNEVIEYEELFEGTVNSSKIYVRRIASKALEHNAAAIIFAHNHPSGTLNPSQQDIDITNDLKNIFDTLDIKVLDHFIVSNAGWHSISTGDESHYD